MAIRETWISEPWGQDDPDDALWFLDRAVDADTNPYQVINLRGLWWVSAPDGDLDGPYMCRGAAADRADEIWEMGR